MENGVSLMGELPMMKFMFAVPQGLHHMVLSLKQYGMAENQALHNEKLSMYFRHCE